MSRLIPHHDAKEPQPYTVENTPEWAMNKRILALESELVEQARIVGMGAERELALLAKVDQLESALVEWKIQKENWHASCLVLESENRRLREKFELLRDGYFGINFREVAREALAPKGAQDGI